MVQLWYCFPSEQLKFWPLRREKEGRRISRNGQPEPREVELLLACISHAISPKMQALTWGLSCGVGFVSCRVLVAKEGATGVASVKSSKKLPLLQVWPTPGQGQGNQHLCNNILKTGKTCWAVFFVLEGLFGGDRSRTGERQPCGHPGQQGSMGKGMLEQPFTFSPCWNVSLSPCSP